MLFSIMCSRVKDFYQHMDLASVAFGAGVGGLIFLVTWQVSELSLPPALYFTHQLYTSFTDSLVHSHTHSLLHPHTHSKTQAKLIILSEQLLSFNFTYSYDLIALSHTHILIISPHIPQLGWKIHLNTRQFTHTLGLHSPVHPPAHQRCRLSMTGSFVILHIEHV